LVKLIRELGNASKCRIDSNKIFTLESDASYEAIAATLTQDGRPVAFFSRTLSASERNHSSVEKEAYAIVESIRRWSHLLLAKTFTVITDQRSVSFMFDQTHKSSIKNDKIARWRLELMPYKFVIKYRPGALNIPADALSRKEPKPVIKRKFKKTKKVAKVLHVSSMGASAVTRAKQVHEEYSHPGVTRFWAVIKQLNIAVTLEEVREICKNCSVCARVKPKFASVAPGRLVHALRPWDRISLDFKGPLTNTSVGNRFLLIVVDEYSRYPFAFPCKEASAESVIKALKSIISLFGAPKHVHSDRGTAFLALSVKQFLFSNGINSSHSTPYHPVGNSQCERYVGIIWKTITLELEQLKLSMHQWDTVVDRALASIRALINTSTNETPHSRMFVFAHNRVFNESNYVEAEKEMYLRKFVRNKSDPLVAEKVTIVNYNPNYSDILHANGRSDRVSNNDLTPCPDVSEEVDVPPLVDNFSCSPVPSSDNRLCVPSDTVPDESPRSKPANETAVSTPRRSGRVSRPPDRLNL
jgi:transposase InsO family protein